MRQKIILQNLLRIVKVFSASESPILLEAEHWTVLPFMSSVAWKVKVFLNCMVSLAEKESSSIFRSMSGMGLPPLAWQDTTTQSPTLTSSTELPATNNSNFGGLGSTERNIIILKKLHMETFLPLQVGMLPFQNLPVQATVSLPSISVPGLQRYLGENKQISYETSPRMSCCFLTCKRRHASELFLVHKEYQAFRSDRRYFLK